ncbi:mitotic fidelity of chromosome transmission- protein [Ascochyta rabiei]|uniref:CENP-C homolog n=1 Tax=Didymella rabiei TaxID=5454 RepID=A0A163K0W7_DIDRA|nr:mitotic fidelity of chromosome transmission- protein [Ascochyta rabiei]KZM26709.1 centromeric DNA binding [Ascochyta rabiei]UPX18491.1 mitotic fidelity of chromosome transmission- protein [Ascochyta rabiei]
MAPQRKRDNRENAFFNVGVQGRKTGITLEERARDDNGLEAISGIFSSPEKSPPKRGSTNTASESMDIQESSIPNINTSAAILRNNRTHLPPPRSRSPMKTALGSSPRRQSSMAPRGSSIAPSSPIRATSHPAVARRLDFEEEEEDASLQETPALSGSGQRRGKRNDIYTLEHSPSRQHSAVLEESELQEEISANNEEEELLVMAEIEESFVAQIRDDLVTGVDAVESLLEEETQLEEDIVQEPVKEKAKRGRKRKSDLAVVTEEESPKPTKARKRGPAAAQALEPAKKGKKAAAAPVVPSRRSKRVSDINEQEPNMPEEASALDNSVVADVSEQLEEVSVAPKRRGRPPKAQKHAEVELLAPAKKTKTAAAKDAAKEKAGPVFMKPSKPVAISKEKPAPKGKENVKAADNVSKDEAGRPVDLYGNPLSKADIERMSTASVGSRYGRGRHLSVFREMEPDAIARVGRTGRHRVAPIDFWKNDRINYNHDGSMATVVKAPSPEPVTRTSTYYKKGKKKTLTAIEEDEVELDPWEEDDGFLTGNYKDYDPANEFTSPGLVEGVLAWSEKGIKPEAVGDGSFQYARIGGSGPAGFLNWGMIELRADQMKRSKNSRKMHMVFNVQSGAVEVKVHENEFTVHKGGIWQVPRGNTYSIKNVSSGTTRIFFAQARETFADEE